MNAIAKLYELGDDEYRYVIAHDRDGECGCGVDLGCGDWPDVPPWIEQDITCGQVAAILEGGCDSGAYMPAVTYHEALETMGRYGNDVLQYLEDRDYLSDFPSTFSASGHSWASFACLLVSAAVETWAREVEGAIE